MPGVIFFLGLPLVLAMLLKIPSQMEVALQSTQKVLVVYGWIGLDPTWKASPPGAPCSANNILVLYILFIGFIFGVTWDMFMDFPPAEGSNCHRAFERKFCSLFDQRLQTSWCFLWHSIQTKRRFTKEFNFSKSPQDISRECWAQWVFRHGCSHTQSGT